MPTKSSTSRTGIHLQRNTQGTATQRKSQENAMLSTAAADDRADQRRRRRRRRRRGAAEAAAEMTTTATTTAKTTKDDDERRRRRATERENNGEGSDDESSEEERGRAQVTGGKLLNTKATIFEPVSCSSETRKPRFTPNRGGSDVPSRDHEEKKREKKNQAGRDLGISTRVPGWGRPASR